MMQDEWCKMNDPRVLWKTKNPGKKQSIYVLQMPLFYSSVGCICKDNPWLWNLRNCSDSLSPYTAEVPWSSAQSFQWEGNGFRTGMRETHKCCLKNKKEKKQRCVVPGSATSQRLTLYALLVQMNDDQSPVSWSSPRWVAASLGNPQLQLPYFSIS